MDLARDIAVAKLSKSAPNTTSNESGESVSAMYESIYNKLKEIYFSDNEDTVYLQ